MLPSSVVRALCSGAACLALLAIGGAVWAQSGTPAPAPTASTAAAAAKASIDVADAWTRATPGRTATAAIYLRIINAGKDNDALNGVQVENAEHAMLHSTVTQGGVARMVMVNSLPVARASTVMLAPGGTHIMLEGLKAPLHEGESFIITLVFAKAGKISATVRVMGAAARGPAPPAPAAPAAR
jgi:copper(I)-binding protein